MAEIFPYKGIFYNSEKVIDFAKVICPPYDVISQEEQEEFYKVHPCNIIRIDYGKIFPSDSQRDNRYTRAKTFFHRWIKEGVLIQDKFLSFYLLAQEFKYRENKFVRWGIICRFRLSKGKGIFFHEKTSSLPKRDRFRLIKAVKTNINPIFALFEDKQRFMEKLGKEFSSSRPFIQFKFRGVKHSLWRIDDAKSIREIKEYFRRKNVFIADGHHRYEVALLYQQYCRKRNPYHTGKEDYNFVMMYLTPLENEALKILSTHRVIKEAPPDLFNRLGVYFDIEPKKKADLFSLLDSPKKNNYIFGMYTGGKVFYLLRLKKWLKPEMIVREDRSSAWKRLDVSLFHALIIEKIFGIKNSDFKNIFYTQDIKEAISKVRSKEFKVAFFLRPTSSQEVKEVALARERMPHKSTYFYPKLPSGLIISPV
ncbi:MAG: DUF1015 domain-containing protein [Candidatus Omnitrophota bacterium]